MQGKVTIGVFDSGVGGLSVLRELEKAVPGAEFVYYADTAHCPYGEKTAEYVRGRARAITEILIREGADVIVVACNTATSAAISALRAEYGAAPSARVLELSGGRIDSVPFIGMEPAVKPAALATGTGVVGVLATAGTLSGSKYLDMKGRFSDGVEIVESVGRGFVELVEKSGLAEPYKRGCRFLSSAADGTPVRDVPVGEASSRGAYSGESIAGEDITGKPAGESITDEGIAGENFADENTTGKDISGENAAEETVRRSLEPLIERGADIIVLGCTHYPFLLPVLEKVAAGLLAAHPMKDRDGRPVTRIRFADPAPAVARRLVEVLSEKGLQEFDN